MQSFNFLLQHFPINSPNYAANQVLGPPDVYPLYGDMQKSWCPQNNKTKEWIEVSFFPVQTSACTVFLPALHKLQLPRLIWTLSENINI